jgi:hypothetical protein
MADEQLFPRPHSANSPEEYDRRWIAQARAKSVITERGCWEHQKFRHPKWGYVQVTYRGKYVLVHRKMYQLTHGGVALRRDQYVCHTCDVRHCCNPEHLWLGSNSDNQRDSSKKDRHYESRRTHCERGHEFTPENTHLRPSKSGGVSRNCNACAAERAKSPAYVAWRREYQRRRRAGKRAATQSEAR